MGTVTLREKRWMRTHNQSPVLKAVPSGRRGLLSKVCQQTPQGRSQKLVYNEKVTVDPLDGNVGAVINRLRKVILLYLRASDAQS